MQNARRDPEDSSRRAREWREKNLERAQERTRQWHKKAKQENPLRHIQDYQRNAEKRRDQARQHRVRNKAKAKALKTTYDKRKAVSDVHFTAADVTAQYNRQQGCCLYCETMLGSSFAIDHFIPLAKGGSDGSENIDIACRHCNSRKSALWPQAFADRLRLLGEPVTGVFQARLALKRERSEAP